jgi:hypothetical protein
MIVPPGTSAPNKFYIPYSPSTVASCYFGQWVPVWLDVKGHGPLYSYEWYPNGNFVYQYLANIPYPSWQKKWFYGDATGWHSLLYYCNGWSNYIYVYVSSQPIASTDGYTVDAIGKPSIGLAELTEYPSYPSPEPTEYPSYPSPEPTEYPSYPSPEPTEYPSYPSPEPTEYPSYPSPEPTRYPSQTNQTGGYYGSYFGQSLGGV